MFDAGVEISVVGERIEDERCSFEMLSSLYHVVRACCPRLILSFLSFFLPFADDVDNLLFQPNLRKYPPLPTIILLFRFSRILQYGLCNHTGQMGVSVDPHEDSIDFVLNLQYNIHWPSVLKFCPFILIHHSVRLR